MNPMRRLLKIEFAGVCYGLWANRITSIQSELNIHCLPYRNANTCISGVVWLDDRFLPIADLPVCLGYPPSPGDEKRILQLPWQGEVTGFVTSQALEQVKVSPESVFVLPKYAQSSVFRTCLVHNSELIPLINISTLHKLVQDSDFEPVAHELHLDDTGQQADSAEKTRRCIECGGEKIVIQASGFEDVVLEPECIAKFGRKQAYIDGLIFLDQKVLPLIHLARRIGLSEEKSASSVIVAHIGVHRIGFLIGADIGDLREKEVIETLPSFIQTRWMSEAIMREDEILPIIDLEFLVAGGQIDRDINKVTKRNHPDPLEEHIPKEVEVVEINILGIRHAIPKSEYVESMEVLPIKCIPSVSPLVLGVAEHNNEVLPVLDLACCHDEISLMGPNWKMVLVQHGNFRAFLVTDTVFGARNLQTDIRRGRANKMPQQIVYATSTDSQTKSVVIILSIENIKTYYSAESRTAEQKDKSEQIDKLKKGKRELKKTERITTDPEKEGVRKKVSATEPQKAKTVTEIQSPEIQPKKTVTERPVAKTLILPKSPVEKTVRVLPETEVPPKETVSVEKQVTVKPAVGKIYPDEPSTEAPALKKLSADEPVAEKVTEEIRPETAPITKDQTAGDPAAEDPFDEQLSSEESTAEELVSDDLLTDNQSIEEPMVEKPVSDDPALEEPIPEKLPADNLVADEVTEEIPPETAPVTNYQPAGYPAAEPPAVEQLSVDVSTVEELASRDLTTGGQVATDRSVEHLPGDKLAAEKFAGEEQTTETPAVEQLSLEQPSTKEMTDGEPVAVKLSADESVTEGSTKGTQPEVDPVMKDLTAGNQEDEEPVVEPLPVDKLTVEEPAAKQLPAVELTEAIEEQLAKDLTEAEDLAVEKETVYVKSAKKLTAEKLYAEISSEKPTGKESIMEEGAIEQELENEQTEPSVTWKTEETQTNMTKLKQTEPEVTVSVPQSVPAAKIHKKWSIWPGKGRLQSYKYYLAAAVFLLMIVYFSNSFRPNDGDKIWEIQDIDTIKAVSDMDEVQEIDHTKLTEQLAGSSPVIQDVKSSKVVKINSTLSSATQTDHKQAVETVGKMGKIVDPITSSDTGQIAQKPVAETIGKVARIKSQSSRSDVRQIAQKPVVEAVSTVAAPKSERRTAKKAVKAIEAKQPATPAPVEDYRYVVKKGDYLFRITKSFTGNGYDYLKVQEYNEIPNADLIYPDQIIRYKVEKK